MDSLARGLLYLRLLGTLRAGGELADTKGSGDGLERLAPPSPSLDSTGNGPQVGGEQEELGLVELDPRHPATRKAHGPNSCEFGY
jgi:hypothetical protein